MSNTRRRSLRRPAVVTAGVLGVSGALVLGTIGTTGASSHREAPMIMDDPVADNTDVYAFRSPDRPDMLTLMANWLPFEEPGGGPNFFRFGDDVLYAIHIDNDGDAVEDVTYEWRFRTDIQNPDTFLYATGPITSLDDENYNFRQVADVYRVVDGQRTRIASDDIVPPENIGPRTNGTDYAALAQQAVYPLEGGGQHFAGQRDDPFFADIASIFDLGGLRPLNQAHVIPLPTEDGVDTLSGYNVHTTSIQVPISEVVEGDEPVIGIWSTASRPKVRVFSKNNGAMPVTRGRFVQVSRLGNPLVNEVVIPLGLKDTFNALAPRQDAAALSQPEEDGVTIPLVQRPELAGLIEALYPGVNTPDEPRNDLVAVFLTGIPEVNQPQPGFQPAEMLRLNTSIMPTPFAEQDRLGLLAGQNDGWPNGRRLTDDVVDIALRAVAGGTPLAPNPEETNVAPNNILTDGVDSNDRPFLGQFPYQPTPHQGYEINNPARVGGTDPDTSNEGVTGRQAGR